MYTVLNSNSNFNLYVFITSIPWVKLLDNSSFPGAIPVTQVNPVHANVPIRARKHLSQC